MKPVHQGPRNPRTFAHTIWHWIVWSPYGQVALWSPWLMAVLVAFVFPAVIAILFICAVFAWTLIGGYVRADQRGELE